MKKLFILAVLILFLIIGFLLIITKENKKIREYQEQAASEPFKIFLPTEDRIISKEVYLLTENSEIKKIEKTLEVFINELSHPLNTAKLTGVYRDRENKIYIDISANFSTPSDAKREFILLKSLYLTLKTNFNWITDVKILISSEERETLSGHVLIDSLKESLEEG